MGWLFPSKLALFKYLIRVHRNGHNVLSDAIHNRGQSSRILGLEQTVQISSANTRIKAKKSSNHTVDYSSGCPHFEHDLQ